MSKKSSNHVERVIRRLSKTTKNNYLSSIKKYEQFHNEDMNSLIDEALQEQTDRVPLHLLKVVERIEDFTEWLVDNNYCYNTVNNYRHKILTVYKRCRIELPYIEPIDPKQVKRREYIELKDLLTKEEIIKALDHMRLPSQARTVVMVQGGLSNNECNQLTTTQFLTDLEKYHQHSDDKVEALLWLSDENNPVIWVPKLMRVKTKKPYYATIGSEAVNYIARAKLYEMDLPSNKGKIPEKLLTNNKEAFGKICRRINNRLGYGLVAEEVKLRPHMLRKFHATYIKGSVLDYAENNLITNAEIDEMQGRGKTTTQDTYMKTNPLRQKLLYAKVMNNVSLFHEYDYEIRDGDVIISIHNDVDINQKLVEEVKILRSKLAENKKSSEKLNILRNELGDDGLLELVNGILGDS